jgi:hypothetical protein
MTYRNPVPNAENMTMKRLVVDHSFESLEDIAIGPFDTFVNKQ